MERLLRQNFKNLKDMPLQRIEVAADQTFTKEEFDKIKVGTRSYNMDQRWNILFEDKFLYMYRSWTGNCIFIGQFESKADGTASLTKLIINGDPEQYRRVDANDDLDTVLKIIKSHLIARSWDQ